MDSNGSDPNGSESSRSESSRSGSAALAARTPLRSTADNAWKIVVVGGFGVGKTTLVGSVSEIRPLATEEVMTRAGIGIDDPSAVRDKRATTVAFDFGRITLSAQNVLYLFGAPGQERFWFLWDRLFSGALGAVVLVDDRRLADSWYAIDRLEQHGMPFVVARNTFEPAKHPLERIRAALDLSPHVPLVDCDARDRESSKQVLIELVRHLCARTEAGAGREAEAVTESESEAVTATEAVTESESGAVTATEAEAVTDFREREEQESHS